jgi:hypothetical protein
MRPTDNGAAMRNENAGVWAEAEAGLRVVARQQRLEIERLEKQVRKLTRELREARDEIKRSGTLRMPARKAGGAGI